MDQFDLEATLRPGGPEYFDVMEGDPGVGFKMFLQQLVTEFSGQPYQGAIAEYLQRSNIIKSDEVRRYLVDRMEDGYNEQEFQAAWDEMKKLVEAARQQRQTAVAKQESRPSLESDLAAVEFYRAAADLLRGEKIKITAADGSALVLTKLDDNRFIKNDPSIQSSDRVLYYLHTAAEIAAMAGDRPVEFVADEELRGKEVLRQEKLAQFERLEIMDRVVIGNQVYDKVTPDRFKVAGSEDDAYNTVVVGFVGARDIREQIVSPVQDPDRIKFVQRRAGELDLVEETPGELAELNANFKAILPRLYPKAKNYQEVVDHIKRSEIEQGGDYGDCYLLAAINSIKKTDPNLYYEVLARSIKRDEKSHSWEVNFQGRDGKEQSDVAHIFEGIKVSDEDIEQWRKSGVRADLPDIILERAYASLISRRETREAGHTIVLNREKMAFEGGFGHRALHDLLGSEIAQKFKIGEAGPNSIELTGNSEVATHFLEEQFSKRPKDYIVTAGSLSRPYHDAPRKYKTSSGMTLYHNHAYSVVDFKNGRIFLENPHDTSQRFDLGADDFMKSFGALDYVAIKARYAKYNSPPLISRPPFKG